MNQNDKNLERGVVGSLLREPHTLATIAPILKDEYLYHSETKVVYRAILEVFSEGVQIELVSVSSKLRKNGWLEAAGGVSSVSALTSEGMTINLEYACRQIHELYILRELSVLGNEIINAAQATSADCFEIIDRINKRTTELSNIRADKIKTAGDYLMQIIEDQKDVIEKGLPTGLMTGLYNLDLKTGGWQKGNLIILAARPGMGKTALSLHFAKYPAVANNIPTAIFSLEMTAKELVGRMASSESNISSTKINQKKLNLGELQSLGARCSKFMDAPIYIDDTPGLSIFDLSAKAKKMHYEKKIELIIVDYLQLMSGGKDGGNREQEISAISRGLKQLAKELDIPVIALSQLSRKCEERTDKRPILSDLRESGSIEQDADMVAFLFRPEYYGTHENGYEFGNQVINTTNLMLFDIAKGRGLNPGELPLKFYGEFMTVENYNLNLPDQPTGLQPNYEF